jgi:hypothetical protein
MSSVNLCVMYMPIARCILAFYLSNGLIGHIGHTLICNIFMACIYTSVLVLIDGIHRFSPAIEYLINDDGGYNLTGLIYNYKQL